MKNNWQHIVAVSFLCVAILLSIVTVFAWTARTGVILISIILVFLAMSIMIMIPDKMNDNVLIFQVDKFNKLKLSNDCLFSGYGFDPTHELGECSTLSQIMPRIKSVLELGGGAGKISHYINSHLRNPQLHVVVEPGTGAPGNHGDLKLLKNKSRFNDKYTIVKKYGHDLNLTDLSAVGGKPELLVSDCEGGLYQFLKSNIWNSIKEHVKMVINEMDGHNDEIRRLLLQHGYVHFVNGYGCGTACDNEVWVRPKASFPVV